MYIVGFNGPPRSGKDTLAQMLADHLDSKTSLPVRITPLSWPMRQMAFGALGLKYSTELYEQIKDDPIAALSGFTLRRFMIEISEQFMKPRFGPDIWARLLPSHPGITIIPDFGFQCEPAYFEDAHGAANVAMVQVHRDGCDFSNDSRNWVRTAGWPMTVLNDGDLNDLRTEAVRIYGRMVNQWQWKL